jgi:hypothetical protein
MTCIIEYIHDCFKYICILLHEYYSLKRIWNYESLDTSNNKEYTHLTHPPKVSDFTEIYIFFVCLYYIQSARNLDLQSRLEEQSGENQHLLNTVETMRNTNAEQVKKIEQYMEKLQDVRNPNM